MNCFRCGKPVEQLVDNVYSNFCTRCFGEYVLGVDVEDDNPAANFKDDDK